MGKAGQILDCFPLSVFFSFLAVPKGLRDLSSLTRNRTHAPCNESTES